jgi:hypothetical protein
MERHVGARDAAVDKELGKLCSVAENEGRCQHPCFLISAQPARQFHEYW